MKFMHKSGYGFGEWKVMIDLVELFDLFKRLVGKKEKDTRVMGCLVFEVVGL